MEFTIILSDMLDELGLTQTQFARLIGVKQAQVSEWLKGKAKPGYDSLRSMAIATGFSASFLLGLSDS